MIDPAGLFSTDGFMPHGMCYMWRPSILAVHVASDLLIALAYFTIPFTLLYFVRKRADLRFTWIFLSFAIFIVACGLSHVMEIVTIWYPAYWLSGAIKVVTALASIMTAVLLIKLVPSALRFPTAAALQVANDELAHEIRERTVAQHEVIDLNASLEARVARRTQQLAASNQMLLDSNARVAIASGAANLGFWGFDAVTRTSRWDDQMFRLYGREREEADQPYALWTSSMHPLDRGATEKIHWDALASGDNFDTEFRIIRPSGETRHIKVSAAVLCDANGIGMSMHGVNFDVTEQRRTEEALRESEERFRSLANAIPQMAFIVRADGYCIWFNQRWYDYTGTTPQATDGWAWQAFHDPETLPTVLVTWHAAIAAGEPFEMEFPLRGADGSYRRFMSLAAPQKDAGGHVIQWIATSTDITERERATEQFRVALEAAPTGMLMTNAAGIIVLANAQIEALFGYPREELLGQRLEMLVPERFRALHPGLRKAFLDDPRTRAMGAGRELYGLRKDGTEVPIEIGLNPLQTSDGDFVLSSIADITDRKRAAEALRTVADDLELRMLTRTSELKERESLLQEIHHRVKNNLQVISSLINMQIRGLEDESSRAALRDCQSRVTTMAKIHEMLYQSADYAQVPFAKYTRDLAARILSAAGTFPGRVTLEVDLEDVSLPVAQAIPCGLIVNELVANSLKHAFPNAAHGVIRVALRLAPDRSVFLSVSDDGIGISPALDLNSLTSLGVQLVMNLVEQLDGHLAIIRGPGSTFQVTFPLESVV